MNQQSDQRLDRAWHLQKATQLWAELERNAQTGVRFGMFPAEAMEAAKQEGYDSHKLAVALMDVASGNGGMRA